MNKKQYIFPLTEVEQINMSTAVLTGSPTDEWSMGGGPSHPGAPKHIAPVLRNDSVPVF